MARKITKASWSLGFNGRDDDYNDIKNININFENPEDDDEVVSQINTFLTAIGYTDVACRKIK